MTDTSLPKSKLEIAWQEWWLKWPSCIAKGEFKTAFEAGYNAARAEDAEAQAVIRSAAEYYKSTSKMPLDKLIQKYLEESPTNESLANKLRVLHDFWNWTQQTNVDNSEESGILGVC